MANCIQKEINEGRKQAEVRKMNSLKIFENMKKMEIERNRSLQTGTITCREQGYTTRCRSY
jgi:hypothetical protein